MSGGSNIDISISAAISGVAAFRKKSYCDRVVWGAG